ncbi:hypothetical protein D9613_011198 [Agrocybe pediades]|uniref:Tyrosinase copper-binding domain-containing protein n=1 Tax=Agrocybe pediades TaxID=84607 RepID=A0A8H4VJ57_9AGAR|nr:hypothetical protein D9613_011198 [Agrocybe pediades]
MAHRSRPGTLGTRMRKNAKDLTPDEFARFIQVLKTMKARTRPGGIVSLYDEFAAMHMGAVELYKYWQRSNADVSTESSYNPSNGPADPAHDNPGFLPWHRQFLLEFESVMQTVDPSVTLPYWDWTDREFTQKLLSPSMMGGNGGHNSTGGAVISGPFSLQEGWSCPLALHRSSWFRFPIFEKQTNFKSKKDEVDPQQLSLGRSIVRYLGDFDDLATTADIIEFSKSYDSCDETLESPRDYDTLGSVRELTPGFRWSLEGGPHMHNQTHDWFGMHTTILQDDQVVGASTMPNVACATLDPMFFLHHANIDRLWAEWQDSGHYGPTQVMGSFNLCGFLIDFNRFYPKTSDHLWVYADMESVLKGQPIRRHVYPEGHNLDDNMWPWNEGRTQTEPDVQAMIPCFPYTISPRDTLDYRLMGYCYDTSKSLAVNNVEPVLVHLPATMNEKTHQVFPLHIQREGRYLIAAKNTGVDHGHLAIKVYKNYEEMSELTFLEHGFHGDHIEPEPDRDETNASTSAVWMLLRGLYYVVVSAKVILEGTDGPTKATVEAMYEIGAATSLDFHLPNIPVVPGVIANPQVPPESCVYIANHRYAPIKLEAERPQYRMTRMKGTHELFGINVSEGVGHLDVRFEGMDALVQLYGPFDLDNDRLPHFDADGRPIEGDALSQLNGRLQIASSEGCCKRTGTGISSFVTPGRYIVLVFHCSVGHKEHQVYKVWYTLDTMAKIRELELNRADVVMPGPGRAFDQLYRISGKNGLPLVTRNGDIFKVNVVTDDDKTQKQVRVAVFAYSSGKILKKEEPKTGQYVSFNEAFWGGDKVSFAFKEDQVIFLRITILNGHNKTKVKSAIDQW